MFDLHDFAPSEVNLTLPDPMVNLGNGPSNGSTSATAPISHAQLQQVLSPTQQDAGDNIADTTSGQCLVAENAKDLSHVTPQSPVQEVNPPYKALRTVRVHWLNLIY
jgi:hypothetical protein